MTDTEQFITKLPAVVLPEDAGNRGYRGAVASHFERTMASPPDRLARSIPWSSDRNSARMIQTIEMDVPDGVLVPFL